MDKEEATRLLEDALGAFRRESYEQLVRRIGAEPVCIECTGDSSTVYQLEFSVVWDGRPGATCTCSVQSTTAGGGPSCRSPVTSSKRRTDRLSGNEVRARVALMCRTR